MPDRLAVFGQVASCRRCELVDQCTGPVPFRGTPTRIAIVGEAPGQEEDARGEPFVGPAGRLLDELLSDAGLTEDIGRLNSVACYPHGPPSWAQVAACEGNKWAQIEYLNPVYLLLLGKVALKGVRPELELRRGRGRPFLVRDRICFASYHPAAALRNSTFYDALRSDLEDFRDLVEAGPARWMEFVPGTCVECANDAEWWEADGIGWCPVHLPAGQQAAYSARQALVAAELDAARRRSSQARDGALGAVEANADPDWLAEAWELLVAYLKAHDTLFVDDFWAETGLREPREARALGVVFLKAARKGYMEKVGFRPSVRSNMTEKPIWKSNLRSS